MGAKPSCPAPPKPVYDATTCKAFVGTGCPAPVYDATTCKAFVGTGCPAPQQPVYDATTCKAFVGTGCPVPVYDATTCASVIKTAVDAKKCAPIFGLMYSDSNENVKQIMFALQNVINKLQELMCSSQLKYLAFDILNQMTIDASSAINSGTVKAEFKKQLDNSIWTDNDVKQTGISKDQYNQLKGLISVLGDVVITVNTDADGKIYPQKVKQTLTDILNSLCLNYKAPDRTIDDMFKKQNVVNYNNAPPPAGAPPRVQAEQAAKAAAAKAAANAAPPPPIEIMAINEVMTSRNNRTIEQVFYLPSNPFSKIYLKSLFIDFVALKSPHSKWLLTIKNGDKVNSIKGNAGNVIKITEQVELINNLTPDPIRIEFYAVVDLSETPTSRGIVQFIIEGVPRNDTLKSKSTFGAMAAAASCSCWTWILLLIIVLVIVGVIYYHNRGNIRMPSLPRRIAAFGRQIKAIRRI